MGERRHVEVWTAEPGLRPAMRLGHLDIAAARGKEVFSFCYDDAWLRQPARPQLDPALGLYPGPQYPAGERINFGLFLDSCPDRWGRVLMRRREAQLARREGRPERRLRESDYLLGVHDGHRMGALRFRVGGVFVDDRREFAAPPWTSLRELAAASLALEQDDAVQAAHYDRWLRMLMAPGSSLGGARPKASVLDPDGHLWIAKFPSRQDGIDVGAWEAVVHALAQQAGVQVPEARVERFGNRHHTFLSRRFDRVPGGGRVHVASAMTLLDRREGDAAAEGASYVELAALLIQQGAHTPRDLAQLWRRMAFFVCVSNTDDHLRNHAFVLEPQGWSLAPAYDMNPNPQGEGLKLNLSESDNAQDLDLLREVAPYFRLDRAQAETVLNDVRQAVRGWPEVATRLGLGRAAQEEMQRAFRLASPR
ncbi:MAG: type II toxin-antitoxin system HipA family toxin [Polyangiales bacterium]